MRTYILALVLFGNGAQAATATCLARLQVRITTFFEQKSKPSPKRVLKGLAKKKLKGIESERLILEVLKPEDVNIAKQILDDAEATLFSNPKAFEDSKKEIIEAMLANEVFERPLGSRVHFAVYEKNSQKLVGFVSLSHTQFNNIYRMPYAIAKDSQDKGYATEALASLLNAYKTISDKKIPIYVYPLSSNLASRRVFEKLGFEYKYDLPAEVVDGISYPPESAYRFPE